MSGAPLADIVAYTDEEQRHDEVRRAALDAARVS